MKSSNLKKFSVMMWGLINMQEIILTIGLALYLYALSRWFLKGIYKEARLQMEQARQEFKAITGHDPPKSSRDKWFRWEK